jgi:hypothetical protein
MRIQISIAFAMLFALGGGWAVAAPICAARTPTQAIQIGGKAQSSAAAAYASPATSEGYRLRRIVVDPALHRRWALIENCSHPERPLQMIALPAEAGGLPGENTDAAHMDVPQLMNVQHSARPQPTRKVAAIAASARPSLAPPPAISPSSSTAPLVRAGDRVHLWSSEANVRLEIEVVALEYGQAGQVIHMRRRGQETLLAGVVVGPDSAELMP